MHSNAGIIPRILLFFITEIVGTKEYRKPEWVTQMEEMQAALKGMRPDDLSFIFPLFYFIFSRNTNTKYFNKYKTHTVR